MTTFQRINLALGVIVLAILAAAAAYSTPMPHSKFVLPTIPLAAAPIR